jgi:carotenoid cleavage dioxygenase-like enzyme
VITLATHIKDYTSEAWIFDAQRIGAGPTARVRLPGRVPAGFHAAWVPGQLLWAANRE